MGLQFDGSETVSLYFAYGSNLSPRALVTRCPGGRMVGAAQLAGRRLGFTRVSRAWGGGVADLISDPRSSVWGALFELSEDDLERLDAYEGAPSAYSRERVTVIRPDGRAEKAWCYFVARKEPETLPSFRYWKAVVDGAREVGLPSEYVAQLESLPHAWTDD